MDIANEILNADGNVSPAFFKGKDDELLIRSAFATVQGEAPYAGHPAYFLRLGGCNRGEKLSIGCEGCDTSFEVGKSNWWKAKDLAPGIISNMLIDSEAQHGHPKLLVITGGEPMLQKAGLAALFREMGYLMQTRLKTQRIFRIQFETNGDYDCRDYFYNNVFVNYDESFFNVTYVVSPKSPYGKNPWWMKPEGDVIYIRRVVSGEERSHYYDIPKEILTVIENRPFTVYLSPQTFYKVSAKKQEEGDSRDFIDWEKTDRSINRAIELAAKYGCLVSFQAHAYANIR